MSERLSANLRIGVQLCGIFAGGPLARHGYVKTEQATTPSFRHGLATVSVIEDAVLSRTLTNVVNSFAEVTVGSVQQSILGVFCIVAAFVLGQYIRTHPSPSSVQLERQQQAAIAPAPQFAIRTGNSPDQPVTVSTSPRLPAPSAGFAAATPTVENQSVITAAKVELVDPVETYRPAERPIDIPDFSKLAASFENTPLALPRQSVRRDFRVQEPRPDIVTHSGSFYVRPAPQQQQQQLAPPAVEKRPYQPQQVVDQYADRQNVPIQRQNLAVQRALVGSQPELVAPPQPTEMYQIRERPTSFRKENFQPSLIADGEFRKPTHSTFASEVNSNTAIPTHNQSRRRRISLAPPEPDGTYVTPQNETFVAPEVPELVVEIPDVPEYIPQVAPQNVRPTARPQENQLATYNANHAHNQIHSYYDVDTTAPSRSVLERQDFQRPTPTAPAINQTNRRIPFGLNAQGNRELTRIRNRQQTSIPLQTDRFSLYTTQAGDTLQSLSTDHYGKPDYYLDIYLANQQTLRNPAVIPAGIQIRIPRYDQ